MVAAVAWISPLLNAAVIAEVESLRRLLDRSRFRRILRWRAAQEVRWLQLAMRAGNWWLRGEECRECRGFGET